MTPNIPLKNLKLQFAIDMCPNHKLAEFILSKGSWGFRKATSTCEFSHSGFPNLLFFPVTSLVTMAMSEGWWRGRGEWINVFYRIQLRGGQNYKLWFSWTYTTVIWLEPHAWEMKSLLRLHPLCCPKAPTDVLCLGSRSSLCHLI